MAYRRKKPTYKRKRTYRKRSTSAISYHPKTSIFRMTQKSYQSTWTFDTVSVNGYWRYLTATPAGMFNFANHATVFDEFKITGITMELRPNYDGNDIPAAPTSLVLGTVHYIVDPASNVSPSGLMNATTVNSFLENGHVKSRKMGSVIKFYFKPVVGVGVAGGGASGRSIPCPWMKTADTAVPLKGAHVFLQPNNLDVATLAVKFDIFYTYYIQFRGQR